MVQTIKEYLGINKQAGLDATLSKAISGPFPKDYNKSFSTMADSFRQSCKQKKLDIQNTDFSKILKSSDFMTKVKKNENGVAVIIGKEAETGSLFILGYRIGGYGWASITRVGGRLPTTLINSKNEIVDMPDKPLDKIAVKFYEQFAFALYYSKLDEVALIDQDLLDQREKNKQLPESENIFRYLKDPKDILRLKLFIRQIPQIEKLLPSVKESLNKSKNILKNKIEALLDSKINDPEHSRGISLDNESLKFPSGISKEISDIKEKIRYALDISDTIKEVQNNKAVIHVDYPIMGVIEIKKTFSI